MLNKLNQRPALIAIPAFIILLLIQVNSLLDMRTWNLNMKLFNAASSVIILGVAISLCLKREMNYYLAKSRLERNIRMLKDFRPTLTILNMYYEADGVKEELGNFLGKCEEAMKTDDIKNMNALSSKAGEMWAETFTIIMFCDQLLVPRFNYLSLEELTRHINMLRKII